MLLLLFVCLNLLAFAEDDKRKNPNDHDYKFLKQKTIDAKFAVTEDFLLDICTKYSDLKISTWDEEFVNFHVEIITKANKEETANKLLESRDVEFDYQREKNTLDVTSICTDKGISNNFGLEITYYIMIPKNIKLSIRNTYGDVKIDKIYKNSKINLRYSDFTVDSVFSNSSLNIMYGEATIKYTDSINAVIRYGDLILDKSNNFKLDIMYGELELKNINNLNAVLRYSDLSCDFCNSANLDMMYSDIEIEEVNDIVFNSNYDDIKINNLQNNISYSGNYSDVFIENISQNFEQIKIKANYSTIKLKLTESHHFNYNINLPHNGSISYNNNILEDYATKIIDKDSQYSIVGDYKDADNKHTLIISGSYSDFILDD